MYKELFFQLKVLVLFMYVFYMYDYLFVLLDVLPRVWSGWRPYGRRVLSGHAHSQSTHEGKFICIEPLVTVVSMGGGGFFSFFGGGDMGGYQADPWV